MKRLVKTILVGLALMPSMTGAHAQSPEATREAPPAAGALTVMATTLPSSDLDTSIAFYTKGLGLVSRGLVEMSDVIEAPLMLPGGGTYLILLKQKEAGTTAEPRGPLSRVILAVPDIKALAARLSAAGYQLTGEIKQMPAYGVSVGHLLDPDGNHIELVQRTRAAQ